MSPARMTSQSADGEHDCRGDEHKSGRHAFGAEDVEHMAEEEEEYHGERYNEPGLRHIPEREREESPEHEHCAECGGNGQEQFARGDGALPRLWA